MEASLGNALARAAVAWEMISLSQPLTSRQDRALAISPLLSFFHALLNVQRRASPSPISKPRRADDSLDFLSHSISKSSVGSLSISPFKTPKAFTSFSLDLNRTSRTNRSQSSYRMETDRVNRLSRYCEGLERKAAWAALRESKRAEHKRTVAEREEYIKQQILLERSFQQQQRTKDRLQRLADRNDKDSSFSSDREVRSKFKKEEVKRAHDDLQRSVPAT